MLVQIARDSLVEALQQATRAIAAACPVPILAGIHLQVHTDEIVLTASNGCLAITVRIPQDEVAVHIYRTGSVVVPAKYLHGIVRKLGEAITLEARDASALAISSGKAQVRLSSMREDEYPHGRDQAGSPGYSLRIDHAVLKAAIQQVLPAAATSDMRPVLTGVLLECKGNELQLVATDGIRLAVRTVRAMQPSKSASAGAGGTAKALIPAKSLHELVKLLGGVEGAVALELFTHKIRFTAGRLTVESALIEGAFPHIGGVIPQAYAAEIKLDRLQLLQAVECAAVLASDSVIRLAAASTALSIASRAAEIGDIQDEIPLLEPNRTVFAISLNGRLLAETLQCMESRQVAVRYTGKASPVVLVPEGMAAAALYLLTPVLTKRE